MPDDRERVQGGKAFRGERRLVGRGEPQPQRGDGERDQQAGRERTRQRRPAQDAVDDPGPEAGVAALGLEVRQVGDPAPVDPRPEQLEHGRQHGHRCDDGAGDDADRCCGQAVERLRVDDEEAGHGDDHRRSRDDHRSSGRVGRALERLVGGQPAPPLLSRANDVEERIVDPHGHPDQDEDDAGGVVDSEDLAGRPLNAHSGEDDGHRQQDRDARRDDRPEREQQHEQRHGHGQELGAMEIAVSLLVELVARGDVARLLDRHVRVRRPRRRGCARARRRRGRCRA